MKNDAMSGGPEPVRAALLAHFDETRRPLPWRSDRTPYRVLVSEFMLQQTRVETVLPYYSEWLSRFPDFEALAAASEDDVLKLWEGLGYYSRARNLLRTARMVRDRFGGTLPSDPSLLRELPGVGEYTAGAVSSIAFGRPEAAVDGNVRRVLSRLYDLPSPSAAQLRSLARSLVDPARPGDFNEALMELGATVCAPRAPRCGVCPLASHCRAHRMGTAESRPLPKKRKPVPSVTFQVAVILDVRERALLVRRPEEGLLARLWEFPNVDGPEALGLEADLVRELAPVRHVYSHLKATYRPRLYRIRAGGTEPPRAKVGRETRWVAFPDLDEVSLPVAQRKIAASAHEPALPL